MPIHESFVRERPFDDIKIGESFEVTKMISEADIVNFAGITGDFNPIHLNPEYAKHTRFGQRIAHGMLTASFISTLIGCGIPGVNALYLSQELIFVKPVFINSVITAKAQVVKKIEKKQHVILKTTITKESGEVVVEGKAVVMVMKPI